MTTAPVPAGEDPTTRTGPAEPLPAQGSSPPASPGYRGTKEEYLRRLRRVEGQVRGLQRMVAEDTYCIDVLTQVAAATRALQAVSLGLLEDHVAHCVVDAARTSDAEAAAKVREAADAIARLVRS